MKEPLKYNFVFLFARYDYDLAILPQGDHVKILKEGISGNRLAEKLFHIHWSHRVNKKCRLPFKRLWFSKMYRQNFKNNLPLCFVYMGVTMEFDGGFCEYVRKKDPRNKQILMHEDLISREIGTPDDYEKVKQKFDLCTSYDAGEAETYGICHYREAVYNKLLEDTPCPKFKYDVLFIGAAKTRLPRIMNAYYYLHDAGLKCKFIIAGVSEEDRISADDISYDYVSYIENLQYITQSRCLLEIIQEGSVDITTRAIEAIAYGRKFITDCKLDLAVMFHPEQLLVFDQPEDIDTEFALREYDPREFPPCINLDTDQRLYFLQKELESKDEK